MLTREGAPFYETALVTAIAEGNELEAIKIISHIQSYEGNLQPSLVIRDTNNINFLIYALGSKLRLVAKKLIETDAFNNSQEILLGRNSKQQTLICQAAELGYPDIVESLVSRTLTFIQALPRDQQDQYHQFWLSPDAEGNSPLHYAAINRHGQLYFFLLQLIENEPNKNELINARNKQGESALHLAISDEGMLNAGLIDALLAAGADLHLMNQYRLSPFAKLLAHTIDEQVQCLRLLSEENKKKLLTTYEAYLANHPNDDNTKQAYFRYKSLYESLQSLVIANLEYNIEIEPRDWYIHTSRLPNQYKLRVIPKPVPAKIERGIFYLYLEADSIKFTFKDFAGKDFHHTLPAEQFHLIKKTLKSNLSKELDNEQIQGLTTYLQKKFDIILLTDGMAFKVKQEKYSINDVENIEFSKKLPLYAARLSQGIFGSHRRQIQQMLKEQQLLTEDETRFDQLIHTIEERIQDWTDRKPNTFFYRLAGIAIPMLTIGGLIAGVGYAIYQTQQPPSEYYWYFNEQTGQFNYNVYPYNHTQFINGAHYDCFGNTTYIHHGYNLTELCDDCCGHSFTKDDQVVAGLFAGFGGFGGIIVNALTVSASYRRLWRYTPPIIIHDDEWMDLINTIQDYIIQPFHQLPPDKLPTDGKRMADLTQEINSLATHHSPPEIIAKFNAILAHIRQIKNDMKFSRKPFTQLIDEESSTDSLDEVEHQPSELLLQMP